MRIRGFEKISFLQFEKIFAYHVDDLKTTYDALIKPKRKTKGSAGYDLHAVYDFVLEPGDSILVPTGFKAYMQKQEFLIIVIRSSLGIKKGIMLKNNMGIIDQDYYNNIDNEGNISIGLINTSKEAWVCRGGDAIAQAIFIPYLSADEDDVKSVRLGGIGSTDERMKI